MDSSSLIEDGLTLLIFGMGFVYVFLTLLVVTTGLMSRLVTKYAPDPEPVAPIRRKAAPAAAAAADQERLLAVISAAIQQYRAHHKR